MEYTIIRSKRKTLALEVNDGGVVVRAPRWAARHDIDAFVRQHETWIGRRQEKLRASREAAAALGPLSPAELRTLRERAKAVFPARVRHYAPLVGVEVGRITIRVQRTRWGSCSAKGNLNFNCLLLLAPPEALDSVVVHELCHLKHMDHSPAFYAEVLRVFPEYRKWNRWLKENGPALLRRAQETEEDHGA